MPRQKQRSANRTMHVRTKKALFRTKRMSVMDEKAQEAKLIKIMSVLEQHQIATVRKAIYFRQDLKGRFDELLDQHKVDVKKALSMCKGNPTLVNGLNTLLSNHADKFKRNILIVTQQYGEQIKEEFMTTEQRYDVIYFLFCSYVYV